VKGKTMVETRELIFVHDVLCEYLKSGLMDENRKAVKQTIQSISEDLHLERRMTENIHLYGVAKHDVLKKIDG